MGFIQRNEKIVRKNAKKPLTISKGFGIINELNQAAAQTGTRAGVAQLVEQLICNQQVGGSSPSTSSILLGMYDLRFIQVYREDYPSGSRGQTVNLLATAYCGSNPQSSTMTTSETVSSFFVFSFLFLCFHRLLSPHGRQSLEKRTDSQVCAGTTLITP